MQVVLVYRWCLYTGGACMQVVLVQSVTVLLCSATDPSDYVLATTTTTLTAGETTFAPRINVLITDDAISECPEMFTVNLVLPPDIVSCGGTDGSFENVNITILDDDRE